jgi:hypothetical protein
MGPPDARRPALCANCYPETMKYYGEYSELDLGATPKRPSSWIQRGPRSADKPAWRGDASDGGCSPYQGKARRGVQSDSPRERRTRPLPGAEGAGRTHGQHMSSVAGHLSVDRKNASTGTDGSSPERAFTSHRADGGRPGVPDGGMNFAHNTCDGSWHSPHERTAPRVGIVRRVGHDLATMQ